MRRLLSAAFLSMGIVLALPACSTSGGDEGGVEPEATEAAEPGGEPDGPGAEPSPDPGGDGEVAEPEPDAAAPEPEPDLAVEPDGDGGDVHDAQPDLETWEPADLLDVVDEQDAAPPPEWQVIFSDLPGAVLSLWADEEETWLVGADKGLGPLLLRRTDTGWTWLDPSEAGDTGGNLWWAFGPGGSKVWLVGQGGRMMTFDRDGGSFDLIPTGVDVPLYGIWGPSQEELWAVGGETHPTNGPGVLLHIVGGVVAEVTDLPEEVSPTATFFKVWGASAEDVWVVGEEGTILHYDGADWTLEILEGTPRLVTVAGSGAQDVVIVGGLGQGVAFEQQGGGWVDLAPPFISLLNGVSVAADGRAFAAGMLGTVLEREEGGWDFLSPDPPIEYYKDWHATLIDPKGDLWIVGGNLLSAAKFDEGTVLCLGEGCEVPDAVPDPPGPKPEPEPDAEDPEVADPEPEEVAEPAQEPDADVADPEPTPDAGPEPTPDSIPDAEPDADLSEPGANPDGGVQTGDLGVALGYGEEGDFVLMPWHHPMEIVQGCQGGIHVEPMLVFHADGFDDVMFIKLAGTTHTLEGVKVGKVNVPKLPVSGTGGDYSGGPVTHFFLDELNQAELILGDPPVQTFLTLCLSVTLSDGTEGTVCQEIEVIDTVDETNGGEDC